MVQLQFFSNLVFETMGEGVHIYLTKLFPKLVISDLIYFGKFFFLNRGWIKLPYDLRTHILKTVGIRELKFSGFSYIRDEIKWLNLHKNLKLLLWRLWRSWYGMILHLDHKNSFFWYLRQFIQIMKLNHICFILENRPNIFF